MTTPPNPYSTPPITPGTGASYPPPPTSPIAQVPITQPPVAPEGLYTDDSTSEGTASPAKEKAQEAAGAAASAASDTAAAAKGEVQDVAGVVKEKASVVATTAQEQVADLAGQAKDQAASLATQAREQVVDQAAQQQSRLAEQISAIGKDLSAMAQSSESSTVAATVVGQVGSTVESLSTYFQDREPAELVQDLRSFAQRSPLPFFLGAGVLGILAGRALKASRSSAGQASSSDFSDVPPLSEAYPQDFVPQSPPLSSVATPDRTAQPLYGDSVYNGPTDLYSSEGAARND